MLNKIVFTTVLFFTGLIGFLSANAQDTIPKLDWPLELKSEKGAVVTLYQPQLESFKSNMLEGRMAITVKPVEKDMIFGAIWFKARMQTDLDERTVVLKNMDIVKTHFPEMVDTSKIRKFSKLLEAELESMNLIMSLDRLLAGLEEVENQVQLSDQIKNDPPVIYFRTKPAVLMMIDGEPKLKKDDNSGLEYVVNTPFFIVKDPKKNEYFIKGGPFWYSSKDVLKGWEETKHVPSKVEKFAKKYEEGKEKDSVAESYTEAPELIVETKPAELVMVDGEIDYKPIEGTNLLYVDNSESDIIMDINSQYHYILLAGRWYYSKSLKDGDWKFQEPGKLPADFSKIPETSDMTTVRASVPGTDEAQTALLEQSIPQTAEIDRKKAKVEVKYDGQPKFEKIKGTDVSYAVNTDKQVLLIDKVYYCVDDAIWFRSNKPTGPWEVTDERPDEVDQIPPESPVYNVKYVYVYDATPEVVYVGYLPGYTYSYVYGGVVVYGTGYYYRPWYGSVYYPRPVTWGFGVHYNPYTGWGFSVGISYGWIGWGFHPYRHGYWGAHGYRAGYRHGYAHGYRHGAYRGYRAGYNAGRYHGSRNVYNHRNTGVRNTGNRGNTYNRNNINKKARPSTRPNNMYTDKKGNVYQRNKSGNYQNKSNRPKTQQKPSTQQQQKKQPQYNQKQQLDRSAQNRNRGTQNYNRTQQYRSSGGSRPSGGSRGGGGRRR
jgi:hypothetical protein